MKILFTRFPLESRYGGAEVQTLSLMKGLNDAGYATAFLGSCPTLLAETAKAKLPHAKLVIGPPPVSKWHVLSFAWRKRAMQQKLIDALSTFHDLRAVFMLSLSEKLLATEWCVNHGIKVFWVEHDSVGPWLSKNPWLSKLKKLSEHATTICVSEMSRKIYLDLGWKPKSVVAIANGIPLVEEETERSGEILDREEGLHLGCIARLSQEKGVDALIEAVGEIPQARLTIVGTGPDEGLLWKLIDTLGQGSGTRRVKIVHQVENIADVYTSIEALVLPSREHDPFGMVVAEAMTCGLPVIVTDACGIAGYLHDGKDALIVKADDRKALREAIKKLLDPATRDALGSEARETARKHFSLAAMVDAYKSLLNG